MNILIVDDEALARSRLRTLLADIAPPGLPHQLSEAATAADALALLAPTSGRAFDVVLLDIHMPGQDGLGLAHTLQTLAYPPALVFVTAHTEHAVSAFELDAVDYLTKPVRRERLQQALAKAQRASATQPAAPAPPPHDDVQAAVHARLAAISREEPAALTDGTLYDRIIGEVERPLIEAMLARHGGNQLRAARAMGINRNTLRKRLDDLAIDTRSRRSGGD